MSVDLEACNVLPSFTKKPTNMTQMFPGVFKLHSDSGFAYYKIAVDSGVRMVEGATSTACRKMGMESSCLGPRGCRYNDESRT